jgi:Zn finger protein HypA/HybF involved in hydrogenase expression
LTTLETLRMFDGKEDTLRCPDCHRLLAVHFEGLIKTRCPRCRSDVTAVRDSNGSIILGTGRVKTK